MTQPLPIDGDSLTLADVAAVARGGRPVALAAAARTRMEASRAVVERIANDPAAQVYGVNTGFGSLKHHAIGRRDLERLQRHLLLSHSAGVGDPLPIEVVRATMLLRANALAKGASGVRPAVVETLLAMLNRGVHPYVPAQGSVGASGDLAPLSHLALTLSRPPNGEPDPPELSGETIDAQGRRRPAKETMAEAGIERLLLGAKEGLALNNGVQVSAALAALAVLDGERLANVADLACAMTLEAVRGAPDAFLPAVHRLRPFAGQGRSAANILRHLAGSSLAGSDAERVQDGYSLRCAPQVHGAARDALANARCTLTIEINSATDNPLIFADGKRAAVSAGQFHGEPVALACDALKVALAELSAISERRIFRLLTKALSFGLPPLLAPAARPGLGLMMVQFTAAGLAVENKHVAHPSSVDNIPTCEDQEDHVSMSPLAARGARRIAQNTTYVLAAELFCAAYALALRQEQSPATLGAGTGRAFAICQPALDRYCADETPADCLEELAAKIHGGAFDSAAGEADA